MYQIANEAQDFQYKREVCPYVWFGNMEIDETLTKKWQTFINKCLKEDPEHTLARGHFR